MQLKIEAFNSPEIKVDILSHFVYNLNKKDRRKYYG